MTATDLDALKGLDTAKRMVERLSRGFAATHAVLFYGMVGSGKTTLANALVQGWLCRNKDCSPCGECQPCLAFSRGSAVDVLRVQPWGPSRWIKLEAIRPDKRSELVSIQEFLRTAPLAGRNKVVLIEELDRLNADAANALLKTLEEPPENAKLVMTTANPGSVLPTIFSRCLAIRCSLPVIERPADLEPELFESAGGSPGQLALILDQLEWRREWLRFAQQVQRMDQRDALKAADIFRGLAERGPADQARHQGTQALEIFAGLCRGDAAVQEAIADAHRSIMGNGNAGIVLDAMFTQILREPGRRERP